MAKVKMVIVELEKFFRDGDHSLRHGPFYLQVIDIANKRSRTPFSFLFFVFFSRQDFSL